MGGEGMMSESSDTINLRGSEDGIFAKVFEWNHDHGFPVISFTIILRYGDHPPTAFSIQILRKIIKKFSYSNVFPIFYNSHL